MKEIGEYVTARQEQEKQNFMKSARLLDNAALKIILGVNITKPKIITLHELYPGMFDQDQRPAPPANMTQERKDRIIAAKWRAFLGK